MAFDKTVEARLMGVTSQNSDLRTTMGDSSGGTFTGRANALKGSLLWDSAMFVLQKVAVAGGATGGSYTVTLETDALAGYTGLPIANATLGPDSPTTVVMDNLHQSKCAPLPTHIFIDQTAAGAATFDLHVIAKQYRGTLGTPGMKTAERVIQGTMMRGASFAGGAFTDGRGMTEDTTFTLGTSSSAMGMNRIRLWDSACFWAVAGESASGTHDVDIVASVGGVTTSIASTGTGGALNTAGEKLALANSFYGQCPNPTEIIWTEVTAGGISDARVVVLAKTGRGSLSKR